MSDEGGPSGKGHGDSHLTLAAKVSECGEAVAGTARLPTRPSGFVPVSVELAYRTDGRGAVDEAVVSRHHIREPGVHEFELTVPATGPISFKGTLVSVTWVVRLVSAGPDGSTVLTTTPVTILPEGGLAVWARDVADPPTA